MWRNIMKSTKSKKSFGFILCSLISLALIMYICLVKLYLWPCLVLFIYLLFIALKERK